MAIPSPVPSSPYKTDPRGSELPPSSSPVLQHPLSSLLCTPPSGNPAACHCRLWKLPAAGGAPLVFARRTCRLLEDPAPRGPLLPPPDRATRAAILYIDRRRRSLRPCIPIAQAISNPLPCGEQGLPPPFFYFTPNRSTSRRSPSRAPARLLAQSHGARPAPVSPGLLHCLTSPLCNTSLQ
jgi:hypothetical protein